MRAVDVVRISADHRERFAERALGACLYEMGFPADDAPGVIAAALGHFEAIQGEPVPLDETAELAVSMFIEGLLIGVQLGREA